MSETVRYDAEHDILYVYFEKPQPAYEDEVYPGVFLRKSEESDTVIGVAIFGRKLNDF